MKKLIIMLLFIPVVAYSATVNQIYSKMVRSNHFIFSPVLIVSKSLKVQARNVGVVIIINRGMLYFAKNDHEIAWVLGHELAHGKLWHMGSNHKNEYEADRLALKYMAKAGYNRCIGVKILLRYNDPMSKTHPASLDRYNRIKCK